MRMCLILRLNKKSETDISICHQYMFVELLTKNSWKQIGSIPVMHLGNWDTAASKRKLPKKVFSKQDLFPFLLVWCAWSPKVDWWGFLQAGSLCLLAWPPSLESRSRLETLWWFTNGGGFLQGRRCWRPGAARHRSALSSWIPEHFHEADPATLHYSGNVCFEWRMWEYQCHVCFCWEVDKCDQVTLFSSEICTKAIRIGWPPFLTKTLDVLSESAQKVTIL